MTNKCLFITDILSKRSYNVKKNKMIKMRNSDQKECIV